MTRRGIPINVAPPHDGVFDFLGDIADAVSSAWDAVTDAIGDAIAAIGEIASSIVNWAADVVKNFVNALLAAGNAVVDIVAGALQAGFAVLKKLVQGLLDVGRAIGEVLAAAVTFAANVISEHRPRIARDRADRGDDRGLARWEGDRHHRKGRQCARRGGARIG